MDELRRTEAGIFDETTLVSMSDFDSALDKMKNGDEKPFKAMLVRAEDAIKKVLPVVEIDKRAIDSLHIGRPLLKKDVTKMVKLNVGESFAVFCGKDFIGVYSKIGEGESFGKAEFVYA
jgi:tRNA U55 pseudouridine synthase TruB